MIKSNKGETFAETLVALLIGVLALTLLPMSIVTAARINNKVANENKLRTNVNRDESETLTAVTVAIDSDEVPGITVYQDKAGFIYYDYEESTVTP